MRLRALVLTLLPVLAPVVACAAEDRTLGIGGFDRHYVVEFSDAPGPRPAIIVLHGTAGTGERLRRLTSFSLDKFGWVEIYPDAFGKMWSQGLSLLSVGGVGLGNDVDFVRELVAELTAEGRVDPNRVYVAGLSNGGAMTLLLVCQAPELLAGAAIHSMTLPVGIDCPATGPPVPMMFVLGTHDVLIPFGGGRIRWGGQDRIGVRSAAETLAFFARRNGCSTRSERPLADRDPHDGTRVWLVDYEGCAASLLAFIIKGGGHSWAGATTPPLLGGGLFGNTSRDMSATEETQGFFRRLAGER
jgi:polyhydroxybutyrate depolymerase